MDCPQDFYVNCKNALKRCGSCQAGYGTRFLHYDPKDDIGPHPKTLETNSKKQEQKQERSIKAAQVRHALRAERAASDAIAKLTQASGRVSHDGDILIKGYIRAEHKTRFKRQGFGIGLKEYQKGKIQGIRVWVVYVQPLDTRMFVIDEALFCELLKGTNYELDAEAKDRLRHRPGDDPQSRV